MTWCHQATNHYLNQWSLRTTKLYFKNPVWYGFALFSSVAYIHVFLRVLLRKKSWQKYVKPLSSTISIDDLNAFESSWFINLYYHVDSYLWSVCVTGIVPCMRPANERLCYSVTPSLIGWVHTQNDPCYNVLFSAAADDLLPKWHGGGPHKYFWALNP